MGDNIVIDLERHAMLIDFGLAKDGVEGITGSFCGSVEYLAPEILARMGHGRTVDLYGLGVLLFELMAGQTPFYCCDRDTLFSNIASAPLRMPTQISPEAADLIASLMHRVPEQRLGARNTSDIRSHAFFSYMDFEKVLLREVPVPPLNSACRQPSARNVSFWVASPFEGCFGSQ